MTFPPECRYRDTRSSGRDESGKYNCAFGGKEVKTGGQDADDGSSIVVDANLPPNGAGVAVEVPRAK